jgi:hypothetical protein
MIGGGCRKSEEKVFGVHATAVEYARYTPHGGRGRMLSDTISMQVTVSLRSRDDARPRTSQVNSSWGQIKS